MELGLGAGCHHDEHRAPRRPGTAAALNRHLDAGLDAAGRDRDVVVRSLAQVLCCGTGEADLSHLEAFAEVAVSRVRLQVLDLADLDHLDLVAEQVLPAARSLPGS